MNTTRPSAKTTEPASVSPSPFTICMTPFSFPAVRLFHRGSVNLQQTINCASPSSWPLVGWSIRPYSLLLWRYRHQSVNNTAHVLTVPELNSRTNIDKKEIPWGSSF
jgi:hypothetical protein